jgi:hypothetical protein
MFCSRMQGPRVSEPRGEFLNVLGRHLPVEPAQRQPDVEAEDPRHSRNKSTAHHLECQEVNRS